MTYFYDISDPLIGTATRGALERLKQEQNTLELCLDLLEDDPEANQKRDALLKRFLQIRDTLTKALEESERNLTNSKQDIITKYNVVDSVSGLQTLEDEITLKKNKLREKHEQEWRQLEVRLEFLF